MHGMMFFPWVGPFGGPWVLLIPLVVIVSIAIASRIAARSNRRERRAAKPRKMSLQDQILRLALRKDGLVTVTDVVAEAGLSFKKAEKALKDMVDFSHVSMRVSDSGVIVYEFTEIRHKDRESAKTLSEMGV